MSMADVDAPPVAPATPVSPFVIVFGNEKGGSGKTTTAMHVATALLRLGKSVATIDLDSRQATFTRYVENRKALGQRSGRTVPLPMHQVVRRSTLPLRPEAEAEESEALHAAFLAAGPVDFIVVDTPGSDTFLGRLGHTLADLVVTPLNDSFVDFDLLGQIDAVTFQVKRPSVYAELVWQSRQRRAMTGRKPLDWVVLRTRVSTLETKNRKRLGDVLESLAPRIGFRISPGLHERVIYRELFPYGLTLLDLADIGLDMPITMSHVAARAELRDLLFALRLPGVAPTSPEALDSGAKTHQLL